VDALCDEDDRPAPVEQPLELGSSVIRRGRPAHLDLVQLVEPGVVLGARDGEHDERAAGRGRPSVSTTTRGLASARRSK
jgi:hypothetical protein